METETELASDNVDLIWPDTFAMDGGFLYGTTNRLELCKLMRRCKIPHFKLSYGSVHFLGVG